MSALRSFMHDMHTEGSTGPEHTLRVENWLSTVHWTGGVSPSTLGLSLLGEENWLFTVHWTGGVLPSVLGLSLLGDGAETLGGDSSR